MNVYAKSLSLTCPNHKCQNLVVNAVVKDNSNGAGGYSVRVYCGTHGASNWNTCKGIVIRVNHKDF